MIINVWKPISKNGIIVEYSLRDISDIYKKGSTGFKIIYKCDNENCKFPNKLHSILRYHLNISRSKKMHENLQICRSCQSSGINNPKYADNRTWDQIMGKERSKDMKSRYSLEFTGNNNPSKYDSVKNKKNQIIINFENVSKLVNNSGYVLNQISGDNKFADLLLTCDKNHTFNMKYQSFKRGHRCKLCFYDSIRISPENIEKFERYSKIVRYRSISSFKKHKSLIDPLGLKLQNSNKYHIDHMYSIYDGFKNNVDINIISSYINLKVLSKEENLKKGIKSNISLEDLLEKYKNSFTHHF